MRIAAILFCSLLSAIASGSRVSAQVAGGDEVEFFSGQRFTGTITDQTITFKSRLGSVDVAPASILTLVCQPPPHVLQTLTTRDGDILVGRAAVSAIHLRPSDADAAAMEIPLSQISRINVAARPVTTPAPTTAPAGEEAIVYGLSGDRIAVDMPASLEFQTRWGRLSLGAQQVRQIVFCAKDQVAHRIGLADGSSMTGILAAQTLDLHLRNLNATLSVPVGEMAKLTGTSDSTSAPGGRMELVGGDILRGSLQGNLTLDTGFSQMTLAADSIQHIAPNPDSRADLTVLLTDGRELHGAVEDTPLDCRLDGGVNVSVPPAMILAYSKLANASSNDPAESTPAPDTGPLQSQITQLVQQLQDPDQEVRQMAQNQLVSLGPPAVKPLTQLRPHQIPRVRTQINNVIARIRANGQ